MLEALKNIDTLLMVCVGLVVLLSLLILLKLTGESILSNIKRLGKAIVRLFYKGIEKQESSYKDRVQLAKITEKNATDKIYRLMHELIIDLNLRYKTKNNKKGEFISPFELEAYIILGSAALGIAICKIVFDSFLMSIIIVPSIIMGVTCVLYTKANLAHDLRIDATIEAVNTVCSNITNGVRPAIRDNLDAFPRQVREPFVNFIDGVDYDNRDIQWALEHLELELGGMTHEFIQDCIEYELRQEKGLEGVFADIVEQNNLKTDLRNDAKRAFEQVQTTFKICMCMIVGFLIGTIIVLPAVREIYLNTTIGHILIVIDVLIVIIQYVIITSLRAKEL